MTHIHAANSQPAPLIDIAIIGGGVSGAYTAYRLMKSDPAASPVLKRLLQISGKDRLDIGLFELSNRIGGRLWSYHLPGMTSLPAELGGQGFAQYMQNVYGLATQELRLELSASSSYNKRYFQYLRGHRFNYKDNLLRGPRKKKYYPGVIPYFLKNDEKEKDLDELIEEASLAGIPEQIKTVIADIEEALKQGDLGGAFKKRKQELIPLLRNARVNDSGPAFSQRPLYELGFWNVLEARLSSEAYQLISDSSYDYSDFRNFNFYDSIVSNLDADFCFDLNPQPFVQLKNGYQELPKTLVKHFRDEGGSVHLQTMLRCLRLEYHNGEPLIALDIGPTGVPLDSTLYARYVVLALPQRALELLDPASVIFQNPRFKTEMNTVTPALAGKIFLAYDQPWWEALEYGPGKVPNEQITCGFSITDLPIRVCYYIGKQEDGKSLLLASLNDDVISPFWDGFLHASRMGVHNAPYGGNPNSGFNLFAPEDMVSAVQRQLVQMHGLKPGKFPEPYAAIYHYWGDDPFGGGWHDWNPHVRSWEVIPSIRQPIPGVNIFLCGEAYSASQGWVEGALNTAEMVLETHFGLPRPDWVHPEYDFGP
ncbi:MAG: FAD-dependent oxidoreductase [Anaerolineales bacterium]|nr:FAD-dependent oxidoreductase [Anaerolineales bacterium]